MLQMTKNPRARGRINNGKMWNGLVDGRTRTSKRVASLTEAYTALMRRKPNDFEKSLLRTAACEAILIEAFEEDFAATGQMHEGYAALIRDHGEKLQRLGVLLPIAARPVMRASGADKAPEQVEHIADDKLPEHVPEQVKHNMPEQANAAPR